MSETSQSADLHVNSPLNPFKVNDDVISKDISIHHDGAQVVSKDVNSLFEFASKIVRSRLSNFTHSLDLKHVTVDVVEKKVPESAFRPTYSQLKEIVSQMTCDSLKESNAHESVVGVLKKLKSYRWDAKAVIALSAFALDFGQTRRRLSLTQVRKKEDNASLELQVFRLAEEENKPTQLDSTLVDNTLELIDKIIELEKLFDDKSCKARLDVYTYWAIFSIFACANNQVEPAMKNKLVGKLNSTVAEINANLLEKIDHEIEQFQDYSISPMDVSSEISQLLEAIIYPYKFDRFQSIARSTSKELVTMDKLKTKTLFLFISGLGLEDHKIIESLESIYNAIGKHTDEKDYMILWAPAVKTWGQKAENKFQSLNNKPSIPRYVALYLSLLKGLQKEYNAPGVVDIPIMVGITNAFGKVTTGAMLINIMSIMQKYQPSESIINHLKSNKFRNCRDVTSASSLSEIIKRNPSIIPSKVLMLELF
ncbi:hypothetical protein PIB30_032118 [Stylosanthes scabra]|uniref:Sieve element occlusion N-terminal domain-containing protein n=1 Tax=Stylosanthes scabra TaxID=79078 RepID=A0ABU6UBH0_9FABA|nr:hypothetical protein [Stylosanthes scabra]